MSVPGWRAEGRVTPIVFGVSTLGNRPVLVTKYEGPLAMQSDSTVQVAWKANGTLSGTSLIDRRSGYYVYTESRSKISGAYENGTPVTVSISEWMSVIE
jgi:hypothetical protein